MEDVRYFGTVGLEIHAELATASKMFCRCKNDPDEKSPNINICPICLGHPGTLPILNKEAVSKVLKIGVALKGRLADFTEWDRKQYFYPDIPKGYQISQYAYPLVYGGVLSGVEIERVHLEEDTAQSTHGVGDKSLINFNRSGLPLMELVTKPVIHDARTAVRFAKELQLLLRYLGAGEANMEKGEMRVEANVSVSDSSPLSEVNSVFSSAIGLADTETLGTKTEVKNLNSFRAVEKAIDYEIKRQTNILKKGERVTQETRGWDDREEKTFSQRSKESAHDYRYFPDPDIPKMKISEIREFNRKALAAALPELPWIARERFKRDYDATEKEAEVLVDNPVLADYIDEIIRSGKYLQVKAKEYARIALNYLLTDYIGVVKKTNGESFFNEKSNLIPALAWSELIGMILSGELSSRGAKDTLSHLVSNPRRSPRSLTEEYSLLQKNDLNSIKESVAQVIKENQKIVEEYKKGKKSSLEFLIGQVMKKTRGAGNPILIRNTLTELL